MKPGSGALISGLIAGGLALGLLAATGCRIEQRTTGVQASQTTDDRGGHADALAGSDAERAKADLDRQDHQKKNRRPAAPGAH